MCERYTIIVLANTITGSQNKSNGCLLPKFKVCMHGDGIFCSYEVVMEFSCSSGSGIRSDCI